MLPRWQEDCNLKSTYRESLSECGRYFHKEDPLFVTLRRAVFRDVDVSSHLGNQMIRKSQTNVKVAWSIDLTCKVFHFIISQHKFKSQFRPSTAARELECVTWYCSASLWRDNHHNSIRGK